METVKTIARNISIIENRINGFETLLMQAGNTMHATIIGITGAPGAGKSTLVDGLIQEMISHHKKVAVLCIDPSSPFNMGALLGDRIRMSRWYNHDEVFIRSMATRKALGGLSPMIIEVTEYLKTAGFDFIIIETVGVGQNEIDIAGLADVTVVVMVPEGGDEIQTMKSGIMEIADIFVVNKCDRPQAAQFVKHLHSMLAPVFSGSDVEIPVIKTIAEKHEGIDELYAACIKIAGTKITSEKKYLLLTEKVYHLLTAKRMSGIKKETIFNAIKKSFEDQKEFNIYTFTEEMNSYH